MDVAISIFIVGSLLSIIGFFIVKYMKSVDSKLDRLDEVLLEINDLHNGLLQTVKDIGALQVSFDDFKNTIEDRLDRQGSIINTINEKQIRQDERMNFVNEKLNKLQQCHEELLAAKKEKLNKHEN